jgi:hypothetical protein
VFNGMALSLALVRKSCRDDVVRWCAHLPMELRPYVDLWLTYLLSVRLYVMVVSSRISVKWAHPLALGAASLPPCNLLLGISPLLLKKWKILVGDLLSPVTTKKNAHRKKIWGHLIMIKL